MKRLPRRGTAYGLLTPLALVMGLTLTLATPGLAFANYEYTQNGTTYTVTYNGAGKITVTGSNGSTWSGAGVQSNGHYVPPSGVGGMTSSGGTPYQSGNGTTTDWSTGTHASTNGCPAGEVPGSNGGCIVSSASSGIQTASVNPGSMTIVSTSTLANAQDTQLVQGANVVSIPNYLLPSGTNGGTFTGTQQQDIQAIDQYLASQGVSKSSLAVTVGGSGTGSSLVNQALADYTNGAVYAVGGQNTLDGAAALTEMANLYASGGAAALQQNQALLAGIATSSQTSSGLDPWTGTGQGANFNGSVGGVSLYSSGSGNFGGNGANGNGSGGGGSSYTVYSYSTQTTQGTPQLGSCVQNSQFTVSQATADNYSVNQVDSLTWQILDSPSTTTDWVGIGAQSVSTPNTTTTYAVATTYTNGQVSNVAQVPVSSNTTYTNSTQSCYVNGQSSPQVAGNGASPRVVQTVTASTILRPLQGTNLNLSSTSGASNSVTLDGSSAADQSSQVCNTVASAAAGSGSSGSNPQSIQVYGSYTTTKMVSETEQRAVQVPVQRTEYVQQTQQVWHPGYYSSETVQHPGYYTSQSISHPGYTTTSSVYHPGYTTTSSVYHPGHTGVTYVAGRPHVVYYPGYTSTVSVYHPGYTSTVSVWHPGYTTTEQVWHPAYATTEQVWNPGYDTDVTVTVPQTVTSYETEMQTYTAQMPEQVQVVGWHAVTAAAADLTSATVANGCQSYDGIGASTTP